MVLVVFLVSPVQVPEAVVCALRQLPLWWWRNEESNPDALRRYQFVRSRCGDTGLKEFVIQSEPEARGYIGRIRRTSSESEKSALATELRAHEGAPGGTRTHDLSVRSRLYAFVVRARLKPQR